MQDTLDRCERDVEAARAKLELDLAVLRSPNTLRTFTDELKQEATGKRDEWVARTKTSLHTRVSGTIDQLKAKAAANPAAALAIGAGVGWYLLRHPSTALVGLGLYSLLRTPATPSHLRTEDYIRQGQERLKEQARTSALAVADTTSELAVQAGEKLAAKSRELGETVRQAAVAVLPEHMEAPSVQMSRDSRDQALLAAAGVAVAAAFVVALQKRIGASAAGG